MLKTEMRNERSKHIDKMQTREMLTLMQEEYVSSAKAVESELDSIGKAVDEIAKRMSGGGRLFYVGCGTSGRLGVLDASECPPTYGVSSDLVIGIIAGGDKAIKHSVENAEDSYEFGKDDLIKHNLNESDSVIGISVAGGAEYVIGALEYAKEVGALTVALSCNAGCKIEKIADIGIHPDTGSEIIAGSTRMKAGSAHKMILNMISTSVMIKLGHVYENLMINLRPTNKKLRDRMIRIVSDITEFDYERSEKLLEENNFVIRKALDSLK